MNVYQKKIEANLTIISELQEKNRALEKKWVEEFAPCAVGDRIEITGYSYNGKTMQVKSVFVSTNWGGWEYIIRGRVVKVNGEMGEQGAMNRVTA